MIRLIEYLITRRRLTQAHRTSPTINPETEPHQTACRHWEKCRTWGWNRNMGDKVTTSMPGNPHANDARALNQQAASNLEYDDDKGAIATALLAQTQAALALAYEQRTATLVNVVRMYADLGMAEHAAGIIDAITNRLGGYDHE